MYAVVLFAGSLLGSAAHPPLPPGTVHTPHHRACATHPAEPIGTLPPPPLETHSPIAPPPLVEPCATEDFSGLSPAQFVETVSASSRECVSVLRTFDAHVLSVLTDAHIVAIANALQNDAGALEANNARLRQFAYVLQIAAYHDYYQATLTLGASAIAVARQAIVTLSQSPGFFAESSAMTAFREQWSATVDSVGATLGVLSTLESLLARYLDNPGYAALPAERNTTYNVLFTLARQIDLHRGQGAGSPWYHAVGASLISLVEEIALDTAHTVQTEFLVLHASWVLGHLGLLNTATRQAAHQALTAAYHAHVTYGPVWLRVVLDLERFYGAALYGGGTLNMAVIRQNVRSIALPNAYTFDQGQLEFETNVDLETVEALYDAMQEVEAQFFRTTGSSLPVPGDRRDVLRVVIYASWEHYRRYQPFLFGYGTNNGGLFVENQATLYTYQRTPAESAYTLEDLVRHEYVHYLDARYVVKGTLGVDAALYEGDRLAWYTEGLAEYLAGSTRRLGVLPRRVVLEDIQSNPTPLTVEQIVGSNYDDGFTFYSFGAMLFDYLASRDPERLQALFATVRANKPGAVDAFFQAMAADGALDEAYQTYLAEHLTELGSPSAVLAEDVPTARAPSTLPVSNRDSIAAAIRRQVPALNGTLFTWGDRFLWLDTITVQGTQLNPQSVRVQLESLTNTLLDRLANEGSNFTSAVAWYADVELIDTTAVATFVLEGPYRPGSDGGSLPAAPVGLAGDAGRGGAVLRWQGPPLNEPHHLAGYHVYARQTGGGTVRVTGAPVRHRVAEVEKLDHVAAFYVTAVDAFGNESSPSPEVTIVWPGPGACSSSDDDGDGQNDDCDICPGYSDWLDLDLDGTPNGCDPCMFGADDIDDDQDGVADACDRCPGFDDAVDTDHDGVADGCDPCPTDFFDRCLTGSTGGGSGAGGTGGGHPLSHHPSTERGPVEIRPGGGCAGAPAGSGAWVLGLALLPLLRRQRARR